MFVDGEIVDVERRGQDDLLAQWHGIMRDGEVGVVIMGGVAVLGEFDDRILGDGANGTAVGAEGYAEVADVECVA